MKLAEWIKAKRPALTVKKFGEMVGAPETTVHKWLSGVQVPRSRAMAAIVAATEGAVQPTDFYEIASHHAAQPMPEIGITSCHGAVKPHQNGRSRRRSGGASEAGTAA